MKKITNKKNTKIPSWDLMPSVDDLKNPSKMMKDLETELNEHTVFGIPPFPLDAGEGLFDEYE